MALVLIAISLVFLPISAANVSAAQLPGVILGDSNIEPTPDASSVGMVEANQFTATASGTVSSLAIYLDSSNQASALGLALYSDAAGVPGTLLVQGALSTVQNGAWNIVPITSTSLVAGTRYWIARLSTRGGSLVTRVANGTANPDRVDTRTGSSFPPTFSPGESWPHLTSMYAATSTAPTPPPTTPPPPSATPGPTPPPGSVSVVVNGAQRHQTIDGFGVNAIPKTWEGGALRPAIDMLVAMGATIWRVDVGDSHSTWETTNDDADPFHFNWTAYNAMYSTPGFENLWSELAYLNSKGATLELTMSGLVPGWMGGTTIQPNMEDEFAEEAVSVAYYARFTRGVSFHLLSPLNETNGGPPEGPAVAPAQFARILGKIAARLDAVGMSDVELVGPHAAGYDQDYTYAMTADPTLMAHVRRFSYHIYTGCCTYDEAAVIGRTSYPDRHLWVGEWNQFQTDGFLVGGQFPADEWVFAREMTSELLDHIGGGASAVLAWDAWDNWHEHDNCCAVSHWGEVYKDANGVYQPKKRFFTNEQVFRFVTPGMVMVDASDSSTSLKVLAFSGPNGALILVGQNTGAAVTLAGSLNGTPSVSALQYYRTTAAENFVRGTDVAVNGGAFTVAIPADSFFTLTGSSTGPTPTPTATPTRTPTPTPTPTRTASPIPTPTPTPGAGAILGDSAIEQTPDASSLGMVEANQFAATASGTVSSLAIYVDASNQASAFGLALYTDAAGAPGNLIAQGSLSTVQNGAWNTVAIPSTSLVAGARYWIARLSTRGGSLVTRVDKATPNPDRVDTRTATTFPSSFSAGGSWPHRTSMYAR